MFEFEPDAYIFTKFANYFKRRKKQKEESIVYAVKLEDIKQRLTIFARAVTGKPIEIYLAEREGGYKNNSFFLPKRIVFFSTIEENISFYLFRVLYMSIQKNLKFNFTDTDEKELKKSQKKAKETSTKVLKELFVQFPITEKYHQQFLVFFTEITKLGEEVDTTFLYGKWMQNIPEEEKKIRLKILQTKLKKHLKNQKQF